MSQAVLSRFFKVYCIPLFMVVFAYGMLRLDGAPLIVEDKMLLAAFAVILLAFSFLIDPFGLLLLGFLVFPFYRGVLQIEVAGVTLGPYTMILLALLVYSIARARLKFSKFDIFIVLLCAYYIVVLVISKNIRTGGYTAFHSLFIPTVSYYVIKSMVRSEEQIKALEIVFVLGIVVLSGVYIVYFFKTGQRGVNFMGAGTIASSSFILFGIVLGVTVGFFRKLIFWPLLGLMILALVLTFSRMTLAVFIAFPVIMGQIKRGRAAIMIIAFLVFAFTFTMVLANSSASLKSKSADPKSEYTLDRITSVQHWAATFYNRSVSYKESLDIFKRNPVVGGGYPAEVHARHNMFLEFLEYGGIIGFLLHVSMFIAHGLRFRRAAVTDVYIRTNIGLYFFVLLNSILNPFTLGVSPYLAYVLMGLNEARYRMLQSGPDT